MGVGGSSQAGGCYLPAELIELQKAGSESEMRGRRRCVCGLLLVGVVVARKQLTPREAIASSRGSKERERDRAAWTIRLVLFARHHHHHFILFVAASITWRAVSQSVSQRSIKQA